tara:strand:- start:1249 stop:1587 length:339 start_codon:yes stop_codon:yes gene_type:complete
MFNSKFIFSALIFIFFLTVTSIIKNKTRIIEKEILSLDNKILSKEKNINEAQLDFYYLTSLEEIERRLNLIGFDNYQPIKYSKIFFDFLDFTNIGKKSTNLNNINEQRSQKK